MAEPTVICPKCNTEIKLTESLAAPLLESVRRDYEQRLTQKDTDMARREQALTERAQSLEKAKATLDQQVAQKLQQERVRIAAEEAQKAKLAFGNDLDQKVNEIKNLQDVLKQNNAKLAEAQKAQAELMRKERELDDARREIDLTIEKKVQADLGAERDKAKKEAEEELKLKVMEKDQTITAMQRQIEELKRRAEQGSQQLQGEVQELELEALLTARFPGDTIQPVPKGEFGGESRSFIGKLDSLRTILFETKRTKNGSDGWLPNCVRPSAAKLKSPSSSAKLPKDSRLVRFIDALGRRSKVACRGVPCADVIEVACGPPAFRMPQTKEWPTDISPARAFAIAARIVEAFSSMKRSRPEKKAITRQWHKTQEQIDRVRRRRGYATFKASRKTLQEIEAWISGSGFQAGQ